MQDALETMLSAFARGNAPGVIVGIQHRGKVLVRRACGLASVRHGVANTTATRMRVGSASKHFTALAICLLAEDGRLRLDDPVNLYVPELPALRGIPTLRQLMNHTAGYRCPLDLGVVANGLASGPAGETLASLVRQTDANFAPGHGQLYGNGGYHLLSVVVDRVAQMPYEQFMRCRVFEPLEMVDTECVPSDRLEVPRLATLHLPDGAGGWRSGQLFTDEVRGEGAVVSTVDDLLRWLAHLLGRKRVGSDATWAQILQPAVLASGFETVYALGLNRHLHRGVQVVHHAGGVIGGSSHLLAVPEQELAIAILSNSATLSATSVAWQALDICLRDVLEPPPPPVSIENHRHLVGTRWHTDGCVLVGFEDVGGRLAVSLMGHPALPVLVDHRDSLRVSFEDVGIGPIDFDKAELLRTPAPDCIGYSESGERQVLRRLPSTPPDACAIAARLVGRFRCPDLGASACIAREAAGSLSLTLRGGYGAAQRFVVRTLSDQAMLLVDAARLESRHGLAATLPQGCGRIDHFRLDVPRARGLRFDRIETNHS